MSEREGKREFDRAGMLAEFYRHGMHDLDPYWSPDAEATLDPFDDPDTRRTIRRYLTKLHGELRGTR